jgi:hypothetical protein
VRRSISPLLAARLSAAGYSKDELAETIARWNLEIDYSSYLMPIGICGACHFMSYSQSLQHIQTAIESGQPWLFGASLHQYQDYFAHWGEGYHNQFWGHASHSVSTRGDELLRAFFDGGYYILPPGPGEPSWYPSPFPAHPKDKVRQEIQRRNPGFNFADVESDWDLVDLYLRMDTWVDPTQIMKERDYFGFNPDKYFESSSRDTMMRNLSQRRIQEFLARLETEPCLDLILPWNDWLEAPLKDVQRKQQIRDLLTSQ